MSSSPAGSGAAAAKDIKGTPNGDGLEPKAPAGPPSGRPVPDAWKTGAVALPPMDGLSPDQQALAQWLGKVLTVSLGQQKQSPADAKKSPPRMLLVSDNLELHELLIKASSDATMVVPVKYSSWSLSELRHAIETRCGPPEHQFATVGLIDHGKPGEFCLLKSIDGGSIDLEDLENGKHPDYVDFFKWLARYVQKPADPAKWKQDLNARVDLMACNTFEGDRGKKLIAYLEQQTEVNWTASNDKTGNEEHGYDWVMESDQKIGDISKDYFDKKRLAIWTKCAGGHDLSDIPYGIMCDRANNAKAIYKWATS